MKTEIKKLKELGANVQEVKGGLKLIGNWNNSYNEFHNLFTEITGGLDTSNSVQHPDFLKNLSTLGELNTSNSVQHPDFLKNLTSLGELSTTHSVQHPDFLKNLTTLGYLYTYTSVQDPDFLKNVKRTFDLPFLYKDSILSFVHNTKVIDGITIHKTNRIGYTNTEYVAIKGKLSAHAHSLKLALIDLRFKESNRDTTWLEDKTLESILSFEDSVLAYRCITGACSGGVSHFLKSIKEKEEYKIGEIIDLTKNEYGNKEFASFFNKN